MEKEIVRGGGRAVRWHGGVLWCAGTMLGSVAVDDVK